MIWNFHHVLTVLIVVMLLALEDEFLQIPTVSADESRLLKGYSKSYSSDENNYYSK